MHIGKHGYKPGDFGYEFDCDLEDCTYHQKALDSRYAGANGALEIVPPEGKKVGTHIQRQIAAAPDYHELAPYLLEIMEQWQDQFDPSDEADADVKVARDEHRAKTEALRAAIAKAAE